MSKRTIAALLCRPKTGLTSSCVLRTSLSSRVGGGSVSRVRVNLLVNSRATAHMRVGAFRLRIRANAVFFPHHPIHSIPSLASPLSELLCRISRNYLSILFVASDLRAGGKAQARQVVNQPFVVNTNGSTNDRHGFPSLPGRHQGRTLDSIPHLFESSARPSRPASQ